MKPFAISGGGSLRPIGSVFREFRESKNITLDMLADEHVSKSMFSEFERG